MAEIIPIEPNKVMLDGDYYKVFFYFLGALRIFSEGFLLCFFVF